MFRTIMKLFREWYIYFNVFLTIKVDEKGILVNQETLNWSVEEIDAPDSKPTSYNSTEHSWF